MPVLKGARYIHGFRVLDSGLVQVTVAKDVAASDFVDELTVMVVRHNIKRVQILVAGLFTEWQTQPASDGLHGKDIAFCGVQRDDGEQVVHIPAFLELVDMQHDFYRVRHALDGEKQADVLLGFLASLFGMDLDDLTLVLSIHEIIAVYQGADFLRMIRVLAGYKYDRFHIVEFIVGAVFP